MENLLVLFCVFGILGMYYGGSFRRALFSAIGGTLATAIIAAILGAIVVIIATVLAILLLIVAIVAYMVHPPHR